MTSIGVRAPWLGALWDHLGLSAMEDIDTAAAAAGGDDQGTAKGAMTNLVLPTHPGLDALAHVAMQSAHDFPK